MNPVRSFAPALWHGNMQHQWVISRYTKASCSELYFNHSHAQIYWFAPLAASVITPIVYRAVFRREVIVAEASAETVSLSCKRKESVTNEV